MIVVLLERGLKRFDLLDKSGAQLETYLWKCLMNALRDRMRSLSTDRHRFYADVKEADKAVLDAPGIEHEDAAIEYLAETVMAAPEEFLDAGDATFLRIWLKRDDATQSELAKRVGYRNRQSVSHRLSRIRTRVLAAAAVKRELAKWK